MVDLEQTKRMINFERDSNCVINGETKSGKTTLLKKILLEGAFDQTPERVFILAPKETVADWQDIFPALKKKYKHAHIREGTDQLSSFLEYAEDVPANSIVVFDDWMEVLTYPEMRRKMNHFFTITTHHNHLWTFMVMHNLFAENMVTMRRNTQNFIFFGSSNDNAAVKRFINVLMGDQTPLFMLAWQHATSQPFGWVRYDARMNSTPRGIVSTQGVTPNEVKLYGRSTSLNIQDTGLFLDPVAASNGFTSAVPQVPGSAIHHLVQQGKPSLDESGAAADTPTDRTSDVYESDGQGDISDE